MYVCKYFDPFNQDKFSRIRHKEWKGVWNDCSQSDNILGFQVGSEQVSDGRYSLDINLARNNGMTKIESRKASKWSFNSLPMKKMCGLEDFTQSLQRVEFINIVWFVSENGEKKKHCIWQTSIRSKECISASVDDLPMDTGCHRPLLWDKNRGFRREIPSSTGIYVPATSSIRSKLTRHKGHQRSRSCSWCYLKGHCLLINGHPSSQMVWSDLMWPNGFFFPSVNK